MSVVAAIAAIDRVLEVSQQRSRAKTLDTLQAGLAKKLRAAFKAQGAAFMKRLPTIATAFTANEVMHSPVVQRIHPGAADWLQEAAQPDWESLWDDTVLDTIQAFAAPLIDFIQRALAAGSVAQIANLSIDSSFALAHPDAVKAAKKFAAEAVSQINDATREQLRRTITRAVDEGWSYQQLAKEIRDTFDGFSTPQPQRHIRDRAELIAVTEMGDAYEQGNRTVVDKLRDAGIAMEKAWLTAGHTKVDPGCQSNADAGWIDIDDDFPTGVQQPLDHPGCRCAGLYRRKPDE
jgi:hypothetical protein